jgi:uncharacterized membrane protein YGL010W
MKTGVEQLTQYAAYHRDRRNIATHFFGIPLIVFAVLVLTSRVGLGSVGGIAVTLATILWLVSSLYYIKLDIAIGVVMTLLHGVMLAATSWLAPLSTAVWLTSGVGLFIFGWVLQFIGHHYEGRKPAFVDDLVGLVVGPMFVVTEAIFAFGLRKKLQEQIEAKVGPTLNRQQAAQS